MRNIPLLSLLDKQLYHTGRYVDMVRRLLVRRERFRVYWEEVMREAVSIGVGSMTIICIISVFVGAVTTIQTVDQLISPLIPISIVGNIVSASAFLELAPTVVTLVLAGKVGSSIASELGTMRVTEQIDAMDVMGINSSSLLILPKILAAMFMFPILAITACFLIHLGGIIAGDLTGSVSSDQFEIGAQSAYSVFYINFMLLKSFTFGLIVASVSSYHGYYVEGGALEVGRASTRAVVYSCILILVFDYVLAQILI